MNHNGRYWLRIFGWSIGACLTAVALFSNITWRTPWPEILESFGVSIAYTVSIVPIAAYTMPRAMPAIRGRVPFPVYWILVVGLMTVLGLAGSGIATIILRWVGHIPAGHMRDWFFGSVRSTVGMTLLIGLSISALESMRARLDDATLALRIKERDEADARRLAAEAQLASLESRVNPHFLFNTLNTIAVRARDGDAAGTVGMVEQLSNLLRRSLSHRGNEVPLDEELEVVREYLEIERARFSDR